MTNRFLPTDQEQARIERIKAWRNRVLLVPVMVLAGVAISRTIPDDIAWIAIALAIVVLAAAMGIVGYLSFGLRCPRCSSWINIAVPKCASCGLRFDAPKSGTTT